MKIQLIFVILAMTILMLGVIPAHAVVRPNLLVSDFSIKEGSATVGKEFTLLLTLTNLEAPCADTITTSVTGNFPFIVKGVSTVSIDGQLCGGDKKVIEIPMKIDPTATGGTYPLVITNNFDSVTSAEFTSSSTINVFVNGTPNINAYIVSSNPIDIYPGDTASLTITLENDGSFQAQAVNAQVSADSPLLVKWSKSFGTVGLLGSKQNTNMDFTVEVPKTAPAQDYPLNMKVTYLNENLVSVTKEFNFMMSVKSKALFATSDAGTDTLFPNQNLKTARLVLKNTGTDSAYKMKIKILPMYPFSTDGSVRYVDVLQPGKDTPVEFTLDIDKDGKPGTYGLDVLVDFEDAQGKKFQDTAVASFTIEQKSTFQSVVMDYWFLWALIVLILLIMIIRKVGSKKKKSEDSEKKVITVVSKHK